jgi:hypothetical protein
VSLSDLLLQESQLLFPTIFRLALDILPIQGLAVPCERVFSSGKETTTLRRNKLSSELMEALQILKYSFKSGKSISFTNGMDKKEEEAWLEQLIAEKSSVPEDIRSYIEHLNSNTGKS